MINKFDGPNKFLSNFFPVWIEYEGIKYPSVEHAYQACKTNDPKVKEKIATCGHPSIAKRMGNNLYKEKWALIKYDVMLELVRLKFKDESLKHKLLMTNSEILVEGNDWGDVYWGISRGVGQNNLGKILMTVRSECRPFKAPF